MQSYPLSGALESQINLPSASDLVATTADNEELGDLPSELIDSVKLIKSVVGKSSSDNDLAPFLTDQEIKNEVLETISQDDKMSHGSPNPIEQTKEARILAPLFTLIRPQNPKNRQIQSTGLRELIPPYKMTESAKRTQASTDAHRAKVGQGQKIPHSKQAHERHKYDANSCQKCGVPEKEVGQLFRYQVIVKEARLWWQSGERKLPVHKGGAIKIGYCKACQKEMMGRNGRSMGEVRIKEIKAALAREFEVEGLGLRERARNDYLWQILEQNQRLKKVFSFGTRVRGIGIELFRGQISGLLQDFDQRWDRRQNEKFFQKKAVSFQQLMAMNRASSPEPVKHQEQTIASDSEMWEHEFLSRRRQQFLPAEKNPPINVEHSPQGRTRAQFEQTTPPPDGDSAPDSADKPKKSKRPKASLPQVVSYDFSQVGHASSAPDVLLRMIDEFIQGSDPLEVLRADYARLNIEISAGDLQAVQLGKIPSQQVACSLRPNSQIEITIRLPTQTNGLEEAGSDSSSKPNKAQCPSNWLPLKQSHQKSPSKFTLVQNQDGIKLNQGPQRNLLEDPLISIDILRDRASSNFYHSLKYFLEDVKTLFLHTFSNRCKNKLAKRYVWRCLARFNHIIMKHKSSFKSHKKRDMETALRVLNNEWKFKDPSNRYWKMIPPRRHFEKTDDFVLANPKDQEAMADKLITSKKNLCEGKGCCSEYESLGKIDASGESWLSECQCRQKKMECNMLCCPSGCANMNLSKKQYKELGDGLQAVPCWGLDKYLYRVLFYFFPENVLEAKRVEFLEKKLNLALQFQGANGWNLPGALSFIIENKNTPAKQIQMKNADNQDFTVGIPEFSGQDAAFARILLDAVTLGGMDNFKVYSKGIGVLCTAKQGIKSNCLISPYFGEIYPPWRWYEKQDIIKKGQKQGKLSSELADFYNIMLDRHRDDPNGFDVLFVDPIIKGTFVSRLSHSCHPNCSTIVMTNNQNKYTIGMYAIRDIKFGEELTFDYNSITESEEEWRAAVCLCGTSFCRGSYLGYSSFMNYMLVLQSDHKFLERNFILYKAVADSELTQEETERLHKHGIRGDRYFGGIPPWLLKWAGLITEYIEHEQKELPEYMRQHAIALGVPEASIKQSDLQIQAKCLVDARLHNLVITIDKIKRLLESMKTYQPPILVVSFEEIMHKFWEEPKQSFRDNLIGIISLIESKDPEVQEIIRVIKEQKLGDFAIPARGSSCSAQERFVAVRQRLREVSLQLRKIDRLQKESKAQKLGDENAPKSGKRVFLKGLADILYLISFVETYFTRNNDYKKVTSDRVLIRACDVSVNAELTVEGAKRIVYSNKKQYDASYIWGQLSGWFKQTVDKPNASLSAERRGTLSYPDLCSFVYQVKNPNFNRKPADQVGSSGESEGIGIRKRVLRAVPPGREDEPAGEEQDEAGAKRKRNKDKGSSNFKTYPYGVSAAERRNEAYFQRDWREAHQQCGRLETRGVLRTK